MWVSVCTVIFKECSSHCQAHPHTCTLILPLMALLLRMAHVFFFSVSTRLEKKKNKIPHRLPLKEQSITLRDFINPRILPRILWRVTRAGNVHTYIFIFCQDLSSIVGFFFFPTWIHSHNKLNIWTNSILSGAAFWASFKWFPGCLMTWGKMFVGPKYKQADKNASYLCLWLLVFVGFH